MTDKEITIALKRQQEQINELNKKLYEIAKADNTKVELGLVELASMIVTTGEA